MVDLLKGRCTETPPFTHCGVDGPFVIRKRRSDSKQYCALFNYLVSRVVLMRVTYAMNTDSFIQALRSFIVRRGTI